MRKPTTIYDTCAPPHGIIARYDDLRDARARAQLVDRAHVHRQESETEPIYFVCDCVPNA